MNGKIERPARNLTKRERFVIEPNQRELPNIPFKTHFVTDYLSDEGELLQHERILEEQLIKDFELMGNEVELVDDSTRFAQLAGAGNEFMGRRAAAKANSRELAATARDKPHAGGSTSNPPNSISDPKQQQQQQQGAATGAQEHSAHQGQQPVVLMDVLGECCPHLDSCILSAFACEALQGRAHLRRRAGSRAPQHCWTLAGFSLRLKACMRQFDFVLRRATANRIVRLE